MELGLLAESYGIGAVWTSNYPSSRDPFISLCPLATTSSRIRVGPLVITPYELHPLKMAKALASLNELCAGRANILVGGPSGVMGAMGIKGRRMVGTVRECVEVLKRSSPDKVLNYQGNIFQVNGYQPRWATDEASLVYVGANKKQMLTMATGVADAIMLGDMTSQRLASAMETIHVALEVHQRPQKDLRISCLIAWHVKRDRQASITEARQQLALRGMLDCWYLDSFLDEEECQIVDSNRGSFFAAYKNQTDVIEGVPDTIITKLVNNLTLSGDLSDVDEHIEHLSRYRDHGLTEVALKLHDHQKESIKIIGERLVPALQ